jgi:adenosylcobinamide-GDP ribazoletransferase
VVTDPAESGSGGLLDAARLALGTLTVVPVRPPRAVTRQVAGRAMLLAPLAIVPLAVLACAVALAGGLLRLPGAAVGALVVGALALGTRGLHLDGLADTADGLASGYDRQRALTVMRSGDVGPAGAVTVVVTLLVQVSCLAALVPSLAPGTPVGADVASADTVRRLVAIALAVLLSRSALPLACARGVPSARASGLGATVAGSVARAAAVLPVVLVAAGGAVALAPASWWRAPAAALAVVLVTAAVVVRCTRRLGGVTGDVLGACVELSFAAALLVLVAG